MRTGPRCATHRIRRRTAIMRGVAQLGSGALHEGGVNPAPRAAQPCMRGGSTGGGGRSVAGEGWQGSLVEPLVEEGLEPLTADLLGQRDEHAGRDRAVLVSAYPFL